MERRRNKRAERGWKAPRVSYQLRRARFLARACDILSRLSPFGPRLLTDSIEWSISLATLWKLHVSIPKHNQASPPSRLSQAPNPFLTNIWTPRQRAEDADFVSCRELGPADLLSRWPRGAAGSRSSLCLAIAGQILWSIADSLRTDRCTHNKVRYLACKYSFYLELS